jgi:hypothetical protein
MQLFFASQAKVVPEDSCLKLSGPVRGPAKVDSEAIARQTTLGPILVTVRL